ncbi:MAG: DUF2189 domain-containing protein [Alphaproteobacteria bacterium]|nr:DUF2189 domain-containing protein [Alphaproteobacteria bacterium]
MNDTETPHSGVLPYQDRVNIVTIDDTFLWLGAGWRDFMAAGWVSIGYGLIFVVAGILLTVGLFYAGLEYLIPLMISGFLLVGPALTVGFHAISRDLEHGQKPDLGRALMSWRANSAPLLGTGLALLLFMIVWARLAVMIFAVSFPYTSMDPQSMLNAVLFSVEGYIFLGIGTAVGGVLAVMAFMGSVASLPIMLDEGAGFLEAIVTSVVAVMMNLRTMLFWAVIIVVITGAGLIVGYIGLILTLPLIGHSSWHAYRGLIKRKT